MKSFTIFLLILFIAALISAPDHGQFNKWLAKKGRNTGTCLGGTRHHSYKVFSLDYVDYCEQEVSQGISTIGLKKAHTDEYLGIFGMFWKL